jgi:hypothetical protein
MTDFLRAVAAATLLSALALALPGCGKSEKPKAGAAQPAGRLAGETNVAGVVGEVVEARRKDGVLTIQVRYRNTSDKELSFYPLSGAKFDAYYVTAEDKKYLVLRDEENRPLAPLINPAGDVFASLKPGASVIWWAKYPAPPAAIKKISYHTPVTPPFDDVPITDG